MVDESWIGKGDTYHIRDANGPLFDIVVVEARVGSLKIQLWSRPTSEGGGEAATPGERG